MSSEHTPAADKPAANPYMDRILIDTLASRAQRQGMSTEEGPVPVDALALEKAFLHARFERAKAAADDLDTCLRQEYGFTYNDTFNVDAIARYIPILEELALSPVRTAAPSQYHEEEDLSEDGKGRELSGGGRGLSKEHRITLIAALAKPHVKSEFQAKLNEMAVPKSRTAAERARDIENMINELPVTLKEAEALAAYHNAMDDVYQAVQGCVQGKALERLR